MEKSVRLSESAINGLLARAEMTTALAPQLPTWTCPDGVTYGLPSIYAGLLAAFDPNNFVWVSFPSDEFMQEIERECCDPRWVRKLKGARLLDPLLVNSEGVIVDGNHRAVKRHKMGHTGALGYRIEDAIMQGAQVTLTM